MSSIFRKLNLVHNTTDFDRCSLHAFNLSATDALLAIVGKKPDRKDPVRQAGLCGNDNAEIILRKPFHESILDGALDQNIAC